MTKFSVTKLVNADILPSKILKWVVIFQRDYRIVGLGVDVAQNKLFWSDISSEKSNRGIYTSDLQGQNITRIVHGKPFFDFVFGV